MYAIYKFMESITQALCMEHSIFGKVFEQIERVLTVSHTAPEVKLLASIVEGMLAGHGETETNLAYSALDHSLADRGEFKQLFQDHHEIDNHFKRIYQETDPAVAHRLFKKALAATRKHFRREEEIVFPLLEKTLRPDTLMTLGGEWMEQISIAARA